MVKSMTGYGRAEATADGLSVSVELKSVNHRFFEFSPRVSRGYAFLEDRLRAAVQSRVSRGKVDLYLSIEAEAGDEITVTLNKSYADAYIAALRSLSEEYSIPDDISVSSVCRNPEIFSITKPAVDEEKVWNAVKPALDRAIDGFVAMRETEGARLSEDVVSRVGQIKKNVSFIETRSPETVRLYREKLEARMKELLGNVSVDEQRLLTETALMADKLAVCEETVRLRSHMDQLCALLALSDPVGKKLDFIVQEMNREANTIGSKAQDIEIAGAVVNIKSEIEKIREQIQNIE